MPSTHIEQSGVGDVIGDLTMQFFDFGLYSDPVHPGKMFRQYCLQLLLDEISGIVVHKKDPAAPVIKDDEFTSIKEKYFS